MLGKIEEGDILCKNCKLQLDKVTELGLLTNQDITPLQNPRRALTVHFPVLFDDGTTKLVQGFRVQYNDALGPTKGGIRIHRTASFEEVNELAFLMSLKTSLVGLPYGGAKGAIQIDPKQLSDGERERVVRSFIQQIAHFIGPDRDIPAPDVNTNPDTMTVMLDEYARVTGDDSKAAFTGKPFALGGSLGRETSTSKGGFFILSEMFKDKNPQDVRVAIQGFGNVGSHLAELLHETGFKVIAVSDSQTGIMNEEGLDVPELIAWKKDGKSFADREEGKLSNEKLLELDVDVLIPAALGGVVTEKNVKDIKAHTILEMANAPIEPGVDEVLSEMGVTVVPDILANAGGVIVSYFEWLQNKEDEQWTIQKVEDRLEETILSAYQNILEEQEHRPTLTMRTVSYLLAIKRILEAEGTDRGSAEGNL